MTLSHPAVVSGVIPGVLALIAALALRRVNKFSKLASPLALVLGTLISAVLLFGAPAIPPAGVIHKLIIVLAAGGVLAAVSAALLTPGARAAVAGGFVVAGAIWMIWPTFAQIAPMLTALGIAGAAAQMARQPLPAPRLPPLVMLALAVCGIAFSAGSLVLAQSAVALAAATAGAALGAGAITTRAVAADELFTGFGLSLLLALAVVLLTDVAAWALLPLLAIIPCARIALRLPGASNTLVAMLWQAILCAIPAALAVAAVHVGAPVDDAYYQ